MHWCFDCGEPCYCDGDDTDYGEILPPKYCNHKCPDYDDYDNYDFDDDYEDNYDDRYEEE